MKIHFICRGNTYRSRLAEAYLKSKELPNLQIISSGIEADHNLSGPITWWAEKIIQEQGLVEFKSQTWQKTTKELLDRGDLTIFMHKDIYDFCVDKFSFNAKNFEVWDIKDMNDSGREEADILKEANFYFVKIKQQVEDLIVRRGLT